MIKGPIEMQIEELNRQRKLYVEQSAKATELDMKLIAAHAEIARLQIEHERAQNAAIEARREVTRLEELPLSAKPADVRTLFAEGLRAVETTKTDEPSAA